MSARRNDIEGLRAISVGAVLAYHAGVPGFAGGYVGVDVFFVVSGFLMTGLLVAEREQAGSIRYGAFYARRLRRLLPASALVLLVTAVAARFILSPLAFRSVARDLQSAGAYVVNLRFAQRGSSYLGGDINSSPVLHYWSLAVEEQFYLAWPVLLGLILGQRRLRLDAARVALGVLMAVSFVACVLVTSSRQPWAFFSLPTRAWEFAAGGLVALALPRRKIRPGLSGAGFAVGLGLVAGSVVVFDSSTVFPGPWAALPVAGAVLMLLVGGESGRLQRLLGAAPMQWVGARSYSLYLWHWPGLVLLSSVWGRSLTAPEKVGVTLLTVPLAVFAYRFVENPLRHSPWLSARGGRTAWMAIGVTILALGVPAALLPSGPVVGAGEDAPGAIVPPAADSTEFGQGADQQTDLRRPAPRNLVPTIDDAARDLPAVYSTKCHVDQPALEPKSGCIFGDASGGRRLVLFGDSHAAQWFPAFDRIGNDSHWAVESLTKSACPSFDVTVWNINWKRDFEECDAWRAAVLQRIVEDPPDLVVLANYPRHRVADLPPGSPEVEEAWLLGLRSTVSFLKDHEIAVAVLAPTPVPDEDVPLCLAEHLEDIRPCDLDQARAVASGRVDAERSLLTQMGIPYIDPTPWLCDGSKCRVTNSRFLVFRDASHLTAVFSTQLAPLLAEGLNEALGPGMFR